MKNSHCPSGAGGRQQTNYKANVYHRRWMQWENKAGRDTGGTQKGCCNFNKGSGRRSHQESDRWMKTTRQRDIQTPWNILSTYEGIVRAKALRQACAWLGCFPDCIGCDAWWLLAGVRGVRKKVSLFQLTACGNFSLYLNDYFCLVNLIKMIAECCHHPILGIPFQDGQ